MRQYLCMESKIAKVIEAEARTVVTRIWERNKVVVVKEHIVSDLFCNMVTRDNDTVLQT